MRVLLFQLSRLAMAYLAVVGNTVRKFADWNTYPDWIPVEARHIGDEIAFLFVLVPWGMIKRWFAGRVRLGGVLVGAVPAVLAITHGVLGYLADADWTRGPRMEELRYIFPIKQYVIVPVIEELLFRKLVQDHLRDTLGLAGAAIAAAILFAATHGPYDAVDWVLYLNPAMCFSFCYRRGDTVLVPIAAHIACTLCVEVAVWMNSYP